MSLQPYCVSTLPGKTKNNTRTADRLLQYVLLNRLFQTFDVHLFPSFYKFFYQSTNGKCLYFRNFYQKFIFKLNMVNFSM